jgi:precorrin-6B methylase 2
LGCGALPATSAIIAMKTKVKIVSIDNDPAAVREASKYFKNLNLEGRIQIELADGLCYPIEKFDVIFVLYGINDPKKMLEFIAEKMKSGARVIFRTTLDSHGNILESVDLSKHFIVKNCVRSESMGSVDSFLLLKKNLKK